jgi:hypothetical protein
MMDDVLQKGEMISSNEILSTKHWRKRTIGRSRLFRIYTRAEKYFATALTAFIKLRAGTGVGLL